MERYIANFSICGAGPYINTHQIESVVVLYTRRRRPPKRRVGFVDGITRPTWIAGCCSFVATLLTCWRNWRRGAAINVKLGEGPSLSQNRERSFIRFYFLGWCCPKRGWVMMRFILLGKQYIQGGLDMIVKVLMRVCKELFQGFTGECLFIGRCVCGRMKV